MCEVGMVLVEAPESRLEWLEWRRQGLGGSDIPRILGICPESWGTPADIWAEKLATTPPEEIPSEPIKWGHKLESLILDDWTGKHGPETLRNQLAVDPAKPWRRCSLDGVTTDLTQIVEAKNVSAWPWETPPDYYVAQVTWCMGVTGIHKADIHALFRGNTPVTYPVEWDEELFALISERADEWWKTHVVDKRHPTDAIEATPTIIELVNSLAAVSADRLALEKQEAALKKDLACVLDGATAAHINGLNIVELRSVTRSTVDNAAVITELAELTGRTPEEIKRAHTITSTSNPTVYPVKKNLKKEPTK